MRKAASFAIAMAMTQPATNDAPQDLPTSPGELLAQLRALSIPYRFYEHRAVFTVAEAEEVERDIPGTHCRNLFFRDKKKNNFLLCLPNRVPVDVKKLPAVLESDRLSFGSPERLWEYLGVRPGSVCPFSIVNDHGHQVKIFLEKTMMEDNVLNFHPLLNTMTIGLAPADLIRFIESTGHAPYIVDLSPAAPDEMEG